MKNKYPAICYKCRKRIKPGAGQLERIAYQERNSNTYRVHHTACAIRYSIPTKQLSLIKGES